MRRLFAPRPPRVLVLVDLVQDIDALLGVLVALGEEPRLSLTIVVSRWLERESPRTEALLHAHGLDFTYVRRRDIIEGRAPSLRGVQAVLAAAESSHPAHAAGHALAARARGLAIKTYALQHGFEQIGLFGPEAALATFASQTVFCWFPPEAAPPDLPAETKSKLIPIGRPIPPGGWGRDAEPAFELGVFENLHWERYTRQDRAQFLEGLTAAARALPHARILLRPHPAGRWADELGHELAQFKNIVRPSAAEARARQEGGAQVLRGISRVITTPSTVALDSALAGIPVALAADGGASYRPLPILGGPDAWVAFACGATYDRLQLDQFRSRVLVAADGAARIVERLGWDLVATMAKPL